MGKAAVTALSLGAEIATYLASQSPLSDGTTLIFSDAGTKNLFVAGVPDTAQTPELAAWILENPGMSPVNTLVGAGAPDAKMDRPNIQVRVRAPSGGYVTGNALINAIYGALQNVGEQILNPPNGAFFHLINALQSPGYLARDELERHNWSLNLAIIWNNDQR
jgi:hypothetical protein